MSYAAMLSPFSMPYPKQGRVYDVKKGAFKNTNNTGGLIIGETPIAGSAPKIKRGDLLCVTRNNNEDIYVWPTRSRVVKKTKDYVFPPIYYDYGLDVNLPVMGVAISSEDEEGNLKAILIKTTPPTSVDYNNINRIHEPSSSNKDKGIFGIIETPLGFSINYEALTPGVVYKTEDGYGVLSQSNGFMECWGNGRHYKRYKINNSIGGWGWLQVVTYNDDPIAVEW